jgi:hypothetical protein
MAHDDDKPETGDDPWAGLESEGLPELDAGFSFDEQDVEMNAGEAAGLAADAAAAAASEADAEAAAAGAIDAAAEADAEIGDWLGEAAEGDAEASSVLEGGAFAEAEADGGELPDFAAGESSVNIGTGLSGVFSPSGVEALSADEPVEKLAESRGDDSAAAAVTAFRGGDDRPGRPAGKVRRSAPPRRRKPSLVGQLIGVVLGGGLAIPVTLAILVWGFGKDPFKVTPLLPESLSFLLPAKFRPAARDAGPPNIPSLDEVVGLLAAGGDDGAGDGEAALPSGDDPVAIDPEPESPDAVVVAQAPPADSDDAAAEPLPDLTAEPILAAATPGIVEPAAAPVLEPPVLEPPVPDPLNLEKLGAAITEARAALEAVAAVDDPTDPVRRRLLVKWYRSLAGYAEELAAVERLAAETGRPFQPAAERGEAIREGLANHPDLVAELPLLTRDWIAYAKRSSEGVVTPATFVLARRVGPYWKSQVSLAASDKHPARELAVLSRTEPAVVPGDQVVIVGLAVSEGVLWASELWPPATGRFSP